jgi:hypothetical protein
VMMLTGGWMWKSLWCRWNHRATHRVNAVVPARQQHWHVHKDCPFVWHNLSAGKDVLIKLFSKINIALLQSKI